MSDTNPGWQEDGSYVDAIGRQCAEPEKCRECGGSGTSYSETCPTCGGLGLLCVEN